MEIDVLVHDDVVRFESFRRRAAIHASRLRNESGAQLRVQEGARFFTPRAGTTASQRVVLRTRDRVRSHGVHVASCHDVLAVFVCRPVATAQTWGGVLARVLGDRSVIEPIAEVGRSDNEGEELSQHTSRATCTTLHATSVTLPGTSITLHAPVFSGVHAGQPAAADHVCGFNRRAVEAQHGRRVLVAR